MQKLHEHVSTGQASSLIKFVAPTLGVSPDGWVMLGQGSNGVAFEKGDSVIKVTDDFAEAELCIRLEGKYLPNTPNVYCVVEVDEHIWLIHMENLVPVKTYQEVHRWMLDEEKDGFDHSQNAFDKLIEDTRKTFIEDGELSEDEDYLNFLEQMQMIYASLNKINVKKCIDFKGNHSGYNAHDELCFFDLRISQDLVHGLDSVAKKKISTTALTEAKKSSTPMYEDVSIPIACWVYLANRYDWEMKMSGWHKDNRMGVNYKETIDFLLIKGLCRIEDDTVHFDGKLCMALLIEKFGAKTLPEAIKKCYELKEYNTESYPVAKTPIELYSQLNPSFEKSCDRMSDLRTDWFNHWSDRTMDKIIKNRHLKDINLLYAFKQYYPEPIPSVLTLYRGIKTAFDLQHQDRNPYSSWTLDPKQGERFATYHFTGMFQEPVIAKQQTIMKVEKTIDEILFFYGGDEAEVVLKNPVSDIEIIHKKGW